jgi:ADP-ribose pyrophosphatase
MLKRWKKISTKTLFRNPWWEYRLDEFEIPSGVKGEYNYVFSRGSSLVIPVTDNGKIVLVKQYRYLCDRESIEFPCGGVKEGKTYEDTAHLELEEETGYRSAKFQFVGTFNPFNGVTNEMCRVYIARDLIQTNRQPDATEEFEILYASHAEVESLITSHQIWDGMTIAAWGLTHHNL